MWSLAMKGKNEYRLKNEQFLAELRKDASVKELEKGLLYRVINEGSGSALPKINSVVTVNYKGSLVDGRVFDNSFERGYPEAFRVSELIEGFSMALLSMRVGDKWQVYIPHELGYGKRASGPIPAFSTLVFDIELVGIM